MKKLGQLGHSVPKTNLVSDRSHLHVPVKVSIRITKVIRRRHKAHDLVESRAGFGIRIAHLVDRARVISQDALDYAIT
jgi:hypothetical protein